MRKGFLHVVESVIVILLVFVVLSQFYSIPRPQHAWAENKLRIMTHDMIYVLEEMDVDWFDADDINDTLYGIPETIGYSVKTKQAVPPVMKVACVCTPSDYTFINNNVLTDITINNIPRDFQVDQTYPLDFDLDGPHLSGYDALLFMGFPTISAAEAQNLSDYLSRGRGIVEYTNLTPAQADTVWHQNVFGFRWTASSRSSSPNAVFQTAVPPSRIYDIKKLYSVVNGGTVFSSFGTERVYPLPPNEESRIILKQTNTYTGPPNDGRSIPLAIINWDVYGNGRAAWMSEADLTDDTYGDLLQTLVMWATAEKEHVVKEELLFQSSTASFRKILNQPVNSMYEPMLIELTVGYHF
ncbi:MAG: hypothetical protein JSV63_04420 [Candidatus Aenigmatarchaeota archaeon]|nr:MAG: hypothetical protein JSV63_04420 [Candidatus Aenigmarchaeota archaeon]